LQDIAKLVVNLKSLGTAPGGSAVFSWDFGDPSILIVTPNMELKRAAVLSC
jgi:hypothetical protein